MYKDVLKLLSKNKSNYNITSISSDVLIQNRDREKTENSLISTIPKGAEFGASSTADRAVTLFQHLVGVGGYHPDLECYELLVRAFEVRCRIERGYTYFYLILSFLPLIVILI